MPSNEVWGALAFVLAALITVSGVWYTAKQSSHAAKQTATLEDKAIDAEAYERARASYDASIKNYLQEIDHLTARIAALNLRMEELNQDISALEAIRRRQRIEIEDAIHRHEAHLEWCRARLERLRKRLEKHEVISDADPDLQTHPYLA